jgi:hypothetical protein
MKRPKKIRTIPFSHILKTSDTVLFEDRLYKIVSYDSVINRFRIKRLDSRITLYVSKYKLKLWSL